MDRVVIDACPSSRACGFRNARSALPHPDSSYRNQCRTSSAPELHPDKIVGRPRTGHLEIKCRLTQGLLRYSIRESLPPLAVDEKRSSRDNAFFFVAVRPRQRHRRGSLTPEESQALRSKRRKTVLALVAVLTCRRGDAYPGSGMTFHDGQRFGQREVMELEPAHQRVLGLENGARRRWKHRSV